MRCVVQRDDFTFLGWEEDLGEMADYLREHYELKVRGILGGEPGDMTEITILNRRLTWKDGQMLYEADPKHVELVCQGVGLEPTSKGLDKPCLKETVDEVLD